MYAPQGYENPVRARLAAERADRQRRMQTPPPPTPVVHAPEPVVAAPAQFRPSPPRDIMRLTPGVVENAYLSFHAVGPFLEIVLPRRHPAIKDIQRAVATHCGVSVHDMLSSRRTKDVVRPRQIAMYLAKTLTPQSMPEIGRRSGNRDHTTVLHAVRKVEALLGQPGNEWIADVIKAVTDELSGRMGRAR